MPLIRKFRFLVFVFLINLFFINCTKSHRQSDRLTLEEGVLSAGVEIGYPPMEYFDFDGKTVLGFDIDLLNALSKKLNLELRIIDVAWEGIFSGLDTGKYDIAVNITILPERELLYNFTRPYIGSTIVIIVPDDGSSSLKNEEELSGMRIACQGGTTAQYYLENLIESGINLTPYYYDKILNCFDDLFLGRVDMVASDNLAASAYLKDKNNSLKLGFINKNQNQSRELIGIALKKGNDALTAELDNALNGLFAGNFLLEISKKYFSNDFVSEVF